MKRMRKSGEFLLCLLFNMLLNWKWSIPAWILLAMHGWLGWPLWLFWAALGLWLAGILLWMKFVGWAARCSSESGPPKENKNPYSAKPDALKK